MTLLEMITAMSIMVMVIGTLAALARSVEESFEYGDAYGTVTQHARVFQERLNRMVAQASANEQFPGFIVITTTESTWSFPDTLVIWHPSVAPANPDGLPLYKELVIYSPDPSNPNVLLEITTPTDTTVCPAVTNTAAWASAVSAIRTANSSVRTQVTTLLQTARISASGNLHAALRFNIRLSPSQAAWTSNTAWSQLPWTQGVYDSQTGLRQAWVRYEVQLLPQSQASETPTAARPAVPFFGSAALYYSMRASKR